MNPFVYAARSCPCSSVLSPVRARALLDDISRFVYGNVHHVKEQHLPPSEALVCTTVRLGRQKTSGVSRIRTGDPLLAKQVLYQLSYNPA